MVDRYGRFIVTKEELGDLASEVLDGFRMLDEAGFEIPVTTREGLLGRLLVKRACGEAMPRYVIDWMIAELELAPKANAIVVPARAVRIPA